MIEFFKVACRPSPIIKIVRHIYRKIHFHTCFLGQNPFKVKIWQKGPLTCAILTLNWILKYSRISILKKIDVTAYEI